MFCVKADVQQVSSPAQSWACSIRWVGSGWRGWGPGSSRRSQSYTWHLRSQGRSPRSAPSLHSVRSSHPGQAWPEPPDTRRVTPAWPLAPPASAPARAPSGWAGSSEPPRTAEESPNGNMVVMLETRPHDRKWRYMDFIHAWRLTVTMTTSINLQ